MYGFSSRTSSAALTAAAASGNMLRKAMPQSTVSIAAKEATLVVETLNFSMQHTPCIVRGAESPQELSKRRLNLARFIHGHLLLRNKAHDTVGRFVKREIGRASCRERVETSGV